MNGPARSRGMSLVGLLVGTALGLVAVAATASLVRATVHENRRLLAEARLMQDLRTAADIVARDLRRAGYWAGSASGVWREETDAVSTNPYRAVSPSGAASDAASLRYSRDAAENNAVDSNEMFGFRLRAGVVEIQLGEANWQALTDSGTLVVTEFSLTPHRDEVSLAAFCVASCLPGSTVCPPRQVIRSMAFAISARSAGDPGVTRTIRGGARLRNDDVVGACES